MIFGKYDIIYVCENINYLNIFYEIRRGRWS